MKGIANTLKCIFFFLIASFFVVLQIVSIPLPQVPSTMADSRKPSPLDLVFVIDNSGSMKKSDPEFITPEVVRTFIQDQSSLNQVSIILFDNQARLLMPLIPLTDHRLDETVETALSRIDYRGQYTNTPVGIERALYELRMKGRENAQKGIILITDGIVDSGDPEKDRELTLWLKEDLTSQSRDLKVRIFGVALSEAADFSLIQTLATRTEGDYFRTYEASQISDVFRQIQRRMAPPLVQEPKQPPQATVSVDTEEPQEAPAKEQSANGTSIDIDRAQQPASAGQALVVVEKVNWLLMTLAIIVFIVLGITIAFFLFIKYGKRHATILDGQRVPINLPEAYLEDLGHITNADSGVFKIEKERTKIGRGRNNDIILDQPPISGLHATIEYRNLSFYLEDQNSTNGTLLNNRKLKPNESVRLNSADTIAFAKIPFKFFITDSSPFGDTVMLSMTALTKMDSEATVILNLNDSNSIGGLTRCLKSHLNQIDALGDKYKEYIITFFPQETLDQLASAAYENLQKTSVDDELHCTTIAENNCFYLICSLPVSISSAPEWYGHKYKGFVQFVFNWLKSEQYLSLKCDQLCVVTFGQDPATWVSVTIVPTHSDPDPVEIMSVDFLNDEEKASLDLDFDQHGRVV